MKIRATGKKDDYRITLKMTQEVEKIIRQYPDNLDLVPAPLEHSLERLKGCSSWAQAHKRTIPGLWAAVLLMGASLPGY